MSFRDKVVFITGAGSGIGRATALAFAKQGTKLALADVDEAQGKQTKELLAKEGASAFFVRCDVRKDADIQNAVQETVKTFGGLDIAFNNAGVEGEQAYTAECSLENGDNVLQINLRGVWLCMRHQLRYMLKNGGGCIVNNASLAGLVGLAGVPLYTASKHGVVGLTKAAALEYAKSGIRVNAVCPGMIETPMLNRITHGDTRVAKVLLGGEPLGRAGTPEEVAAAVLWLSSAEASFVTGHALSVDGGWVAQ